MKDQVTSTVTAYVSRLNVSHCYMQSTSAECVSELSLFCRPTTMDRGISTELINLNLRDETSAFDH